MTRDDMVEGTASESQYGAHISEPRATERIDQVELRAWLADTFSTSFEDVAIKQFTRGKANLTYLLELPGVRKEYVLRRPPHGDLPEGAHDIYREYRILSTLWKGFAKAPRALAYCDDVAVIGAPFMIMERKRGIVIQDRVPSTFGAGSDTRANRQISQIVIDTLVELHAVNPAEAGLAELGRPDGYLERQVAGWTNRMLAAGFPEHDNATRLAGWLSSRIPNAERTAIVHNDWRLDNLALDPSDPSICTAVYDWDMCTRGDPMADLGTLMSAWYQEDEAAPEFAPMPTLVPGFMSRAEAIDRYCAKTGADDGAVVWYVVFGTFKMAVVLQQIYRRWASGDSEDPRFASMGESAERLLELALERRRSG